MILQPGDWVLCLNDMRSAQIENFELVCCAATREELIEFYNKEKVEPYKEGRWYKVFRRGGRLEWYNPLNEDWAGYMFRGLAQWFPTAPPDLPHVSEMSE